MRQREIYKDGGEEEGGGLDLESDGDALKQQIRNGHPHLGKMTPR